MLMVQKFQVIPCKQTKADLRQSQMVKISPKGQSIQLWIFKTLFNKWFKDTEEHSKVNQLHRYITITSARFFFSVLIFFYKKHTKNKIFSLVYHNCTAKEVIFIYMYTILICNSLFKKGCHRQQTHRRQCLIFFKIKGIYLFICY